jgi:hypothetical protein
VAVNSRNFQDFKDEGEVIASFGQAKPVKYLNDKYELRGGSKEERLQAMKWISMFLRDKKVREV